MMGNNLDILITIVMASFRIIVIGLINEKTIR